MDPSDLVLYVVKIIPSLKKYFLNRRPGFDKWSINKDAFAAYVKLL